jgi:hypothetical protein
LEQGIHTRIDAEVLRRFKEFVIGKYGKLHGCLKVEVQQALAHWLDEHGLEAHTNSHKINPGIPRVQLKIDEIITWLRGKGYSNQFTNHAWNQACLNTVGSDERTIKKYLKLAKSLGRIKHYAGAVWEIV